jgi:pyrroline-5-carboxylate reductase
MSPTIAIIGSGNMGASLLGGLIAQGYAANQLWITDASTEKLQLLQHQFGVCSTSDNIEAVKAAEIVIFAVKPNVLPEVAQELSVIIQQRKPLVISIAAGVREANIQQWLGGHIAIVRCMPNISALIGCAASALHANHFVSAEQRGQAESIIRAVGTVSWLEKEELMDAVTALSGSGPAYFFLVIEALQNAAEKCGLEPETARLLTLQTAYGAARMALESEKNAAELRRDVTSPGGTTEQAIRVLEERHLRDMFAEALQAAKKRSEELAQQNK